MRERDEEDEEEEDEENEVLRGGAQCADEEADAVVELEIFEELQPSV